MTRRSWRDLDRQPSGPAGPPLRGPGAPDGGQSDLRRAAELAPDSRLGQLLAERETLERRLRGLAGGPGTDGRDPAFAARFPVMTFAERQAQQRELDARRDRIRQAQDDLRRTSRNPAASARRLRGLPDTPPTERRGAGTPNIPATAAGASGAALGLRNRFASRSTAARSAILDPARRFIAPLDEVGRPLREVGRKFGDARRQLRDLDKRLAAEGISEAERAEIRKALHGDTLDKVGGRLDKANEVLAAPKKLVDKVETGWRERERQIAGPMDRASSYAKRRDRRLSPETGGSGDLFERMLRNRQLALQRRREQQEQEQRDQRRRDLARNRERRAEERRDKGTD